MHMHLSGSVSRGFIGSDKSKRGPVEVIPMSRKSCALVLRCILQSSHAESWQCEIKDDSLSKHQAPSTNESPCRELSWHST